MSPIFTTLAPGLFEAGAKLIDRLIPDAGNAVGDRDSRQAGIVIERTTPNSCDRLASYYVWDVNGTA